MTAAVRTLGRHCHLPVTTRAALADFQRDCARRFSEAGKPASRAVHADELAFVTRWARTIGAADPDAIALRSLALAQLARDWGHALEALDDTDLRSAMELRGGSVDMNSRQRGTIYATLAGLFTEALPRRLTLDGAPPGLIIGLDQGRRAAWQDSARPLDLAREMRAAQELLRAGGHVHILVDGFQGHRGIHHAFFGKSRPFQPGFAELAAITGARIVPVMTDCTTDGRVVVDMLPPFPSAAEARAAGGSWREALVTRAATFVTLQWRNRPHTVKWGHMRLFLEHLTQVDAAA